MKGQIKALEDGDLRPEEVRHIATRLGVAEDDVVNMNRRLRGDYSLNAPTCTDEIERDGEWLDWLVDDTPDQEERLANADELNIRKGYLAKAMLTLTDRE